jgi:glutathione S-transferase
VSPPPRLITIPISHYCEKARWALERAGIAYREEPHLQAVHWAHVWRAGRGRTAPVLVTPDRVLTDSADIVRWADPSLYPDAESAALERWFDAELGPHARRWMYHRILGRRDLVLEYGAPGVPRWERAALPVFLPLVSRVIARYLDVDDATAAESRKRVRRVFDGVAERLVGGRRFLVGDAFSAADLAFAALGAAVLLPPRYGVRLPAVEELPEAFGAEVRAMREHPAGRFALRLYDQDRP